MQQDGRAGAASCDVARPQAPHAPLRRGRATSWRAVLGQCAVVLLLVVLGLLLTLALVAAWRPDVVDRGLTGLGW